MICRYAPLVMILLLSVRVHANDHRCLMFGKCIETSVTDDSVFAAPAWDDEEKNPPLNARKALAIAQAEWKRIEKSLTYERKDWTWKLRSIALTPTDSGGWYWLAIYDGDMPGVVIAGTLPEVHIPILFNGKVALKPIRDSTSDDYMMGGP